MIWCIKTYIIAYVKTQKIRWTIHYVEPTAQLLFKIRFPKGGCMLEIMCHEPKEWNGSVRYLQIRWAIVCVEWNCGINLSISAI